MKKAHYLFLLFLVGTTSLFASTTAELKERFAERLPEIQKLWKSGLVGENNQGYLSPRGDLTDEQMKLVKAENSDRKEIYQIIASNSSETVKQVGQQRAAQIAEQAAKGLWLQDSEGTWYKK